MSITIENAEAAALLADLAAATRRPAPDLLPDPSRIDVTRIAP